MEKFLVDIFFDWSLGWPFSTPSVVASFDEMATLRTDSTVKNWPWFPVNRYFVRPLCDCLENWRTTVLVGNFRNHSFLTTAHDLDNVAIMLQPTLYILFITHHSYLWSNQWKDVIARIQSLPGWSSSTDFQMRFLLSAVILGLASAQEELLAGVTSWESVSIRFCCPKCIVSTVQLIAEKMVPFP